MIAAVWLYVLAVPFVASVLFGGGLLTACLLRDALRGGESR